MKYYKRNTFTLLAVVLSLFVLVSILVWVPGAFDTQPGRYHSLMATFLIVVPLLNSALQNLMILRVKKMSQFFFSGKLAESPVYEAIVSLSAVVLLPLVPGVTLLEGSTYIEMLGHMSIWLIIALASTWTSYKTVSVDFYSGFVAVKGLNFFKSAGLSQKSMTAAGVYDYTDFVSVTVDQNQMTLLLTEQRGQVRFKVPVDKIEPITAFLKAKGINRV